MKRLNAIERYRAARLFGFPIRIALKAFFLGGFIKWKLINTKSE